MPAFPLQNVESFLNKRISKTITPQKYYRSALLYFLFGMSGGSDMLEIGRPNEGIYISGETVDPVTKETDTGENGFAVPIQGFKTNNTKVVGIYGNNPTSANPTTSTPDLAQMNAAMFRWTIGIKTPVQVWDAYQDLASTPKDGGVASAVLLMRSNNIAMQEHIDQVNSRCLYGTPSNQNALVWDDISGVIQACTPTGIYGQVDRNALASSSPWIPQYAATAPLDVTRLIDYVNTTLRVNQFGEGITLILAGNANWLALKNQALARDKGGYMITDGNAKAAGLPGLAKIGITREIVCCNGVFIMSEPFLDTCFANQYQTETPLYTALPNTVLALNMRPWKFTTHPKHSMTATPMVHLGAMGIEQPNLSQSFIETWACLRCERPDVQAMFAALA